MDSFTDMTEDEELGAGDRTSFSLKNDSASIEVEVKNMSLDAKPIKESMIVSIEVEARDKVDFSIAKGITCTSSPEEVETAFGRPTSSGTGDGYEVLEYEEDLYFETEFYYNTDASEYNSIKLECIRQIEQQIEVSNEAPAYLSDYKAPTAITDNVKDTIFEVDGVVYQLPCPVSEFTKNGWEYEVDKDLKVIGAGDRDYLDSCLVKGDFKLDLEITNFSNKAALPENCAITMIDFSSYNLKGSSDDFAKFSGGITLRSALEDVEAVCGEDFDKFDNSFCTTFGYTGPNYDKKVEFKVEKESKFVTTTIKNKTWDY